MVDLNIRVAGEAGQGIETAGEVITEAFARTGLHVFATKSYMSRIRGGLNWYDIRISDKALYAGKTKADLLLSLTAEGLRDLAGRSDASSLLVCDSEAAGDLSGCVELEIAGAAREAAGSPVMANMVAAGVVFGVLSCDLTPLLDQVNESFGSRGEDIVSQNRACAEKGAELAREYSLDRPLPPASDAPGCICSGTEGVALGAAVAGVKFASGYPMTPATGVLTYLAAHAHDYGIVVEQAEDELAAINMVCGAAYAGACALTATSGGGFALMTEGLSLSGMLELPLLIVLGQRPGPATGLPTRTAQQDLRLAINGGHGEFPRAVFAPGTPEEAFHLTRKALEVAHRYQVPSILMTDQFLADQVRNTAPLDASSNPIDRCIETSPPSNYRRYEMTASGVSPRAVPGGDALVKVDSDEHDAEGHITEDLEVRVEQQDKRMRKEKGLLEEWQKPVRYGPVDSDEVFVVWGSTYGPCREAVDILNGSGRRTAMIHFPQVWPLDAAGARAAIRGRAASWPRITCIEGNATAQLAAVLKEKRIIAAHESILKYNGMPLTAEEIAAAARNGKKSERSDAKR